MQYHSTLNYGHYSEFDKRSKDNLISAVVFSFLCVYRAINVTNYLLYYHLLPSQSIIQVYLHYLSSFQPENIREIKIKHFRLCLHISRQEPEVEIYLNWRIDHEDSNLFFGGRKMIMIYRCCTIYYGLHLLPRSVWPILISKY